MEYVQEKLKGVCSLLIVKQWEGMLSCHPGRCFVEYLQESRKVSVMALLVQGGQRNLSHLHKRICIPHRITLRLLVTI